MRHICYACAVERMRWKWRSLIRRLSRRPRTPPRELIPVKVYWVDELAAPPTMTASEIDAGTLINEIAKGEK